MSAAPQMDGEADKFDKDQFEAEADRHFEAMKLPKWRLNKQDYPEVSRITCSETCCALLARHVVSPFSNSSCDDELDLEMT